MDEKCQISKNDIRLAMLSDEFHDSIKMCKQYVLSLKESILTLEELKEDYWFAVYNMALSYKKLGDIKNAYRYAKQSIEFTDGRFSNYRYHYSLWLIGECNKCLNNKKEAILIFKKCSFIYKSINNEKYRICADFNMAEVLNSSSSMLRIIKVFENMDEEYMDSFGELKKEDLIIEMYNDLIESYIRANRVEAALNTLNGIENAQMRSMLMEKFLSA